MLGFRREKPISVDPSTSLGRLGELWAQCEYRLRGYTVVAENEYNHRGKQLGEIDFIAVNKKFVVFVEVKTRTLAKSKYGSAFDAVSRSKQLKILKAAKLYLLKHPELMVLEPRIDVCAIEVGGAEVLVEALQYPRKVDKLGFSVTIMENSVEDWN